MYIINSKTLYLYFDGNTTLIKEENSELEFKGNIVLNILDNSCNFYGSSLKGRIEGAKTLLDHRYKLPVIISEKKEIVFFPMPGIKKNEIMWFNFSLIKDYKKKDDYIEVYFKNEIKERFLGSFTVFNNQILKCSRLWLVYLSRI